MKIKILSITLLFVLLISTSFEPDIPKSGVSYADELVEIKTEVRTAYMSIATYNSEEIFTILRYNVKRFDDFFANLQNVNNIYDALSFIIIELQELANSYGIIASLREDIQENAIFNLQVVDDAKNKCILLTGNLSDEIDSLNLLILQTDSLLQITINQDSINILNADKSAYQSILNSTESRQNTFQNAVVKIEELQTNLENFVVSLNLLLYTLDLNVVVYDEVVDALRVIKEYSTLTEGLVELGDLSSLTIDIIDSWDDLNTIVNEIDNLYFGGGK